MIDALKRIVAACRKSGIRCALHGGTPEYAARAMAWGFDMSTVSGDSRLLAGAAQASVQRFRELAKQRAPGRVECAGTYPHVLVAGKLHPSGALL